MTDTLQFYIVTGQAGEYSDSNEWLVCAFFSEKAAKAEVLRLTNLWNQIAPTSPSFDYELMNALADQMKVHDPDFACDYAGMRYYIQRCRIHESQNR